MDLSEAFLAHFNLRKPPSGNLPHLVDHPGDTCSQGHPFGDGVDCVSCPTERDLVEDAADYRTLASHVIDALNPAPGPVEASACIDAVTAISDYVESLRCMCGPLLITCGRCRVLGRYRNDKVQRIQID